MPHFEIDVGALNVNDHITAGDVKLPAGFPLITPADTVVVAVEGSRTASDDAALTAAAVAAAPAPTDPAAPAPAPIMATTPPRSINKDRDPQSPRSGQKQQG